MSLHGMLFTIHIMVRQDPQLSVSWCWVHVPLFFIISVLSNIKLINLSDLAAEKKRAAEIEALGSSSANSLVEEKAALSKSLSENESKLEELKSSFDAVTLENNEKSTEIQSLSGMQFISFDQSLCYF
jgi:uncharacterized protein YlxW (UPF0749 family)